ncbi:MAG: guanylate kinase [Lachnospiraceae bacterium]|nr:guanylate kinase [Lachnospiraceae bacterium]
MITIFYIMGRSGSGKDTIYNKLINSDKLKDLDFKNVILHTTRPMRQGEKDGREYYFIDDKTFEEMKKQDKFIEIREYNTANGIWKYGTSIESFDKDGYYIGIGTLESFLKLKKKFKNNIKDIFIQVDEDKLFQRTVVRATGDSNQNIDEIKRRFDADRIDFSSKRIKEAGIVQIFYNNSTLEDCVTKIEQYILNNK